MERQLKNKILFTFICFVFTFTIILSKACYIQLLNNNKLKEYSKSQVLREYKVYPNRGNIYDRNGHPLAINIQTYSLFTIPKNLKNVDKTIKKLSKIVPKLSYKSITKKLKNRKTYTWLARKIELKEDQVNRIKELKGVFIERVPKRLYPNHELASQIIGFVGVDNKGLSGIEYSFDKVMRGKPTHIKYVKDAKGRPLKFEAQNTGAEPEDIVLTIDKDLQSIVESALKEGVIKHEALSGGVGVINPKNGEILAIANYPTFDPNKIKGSDASTRRLAFIAAPTEPGSILKTFVIASALEHNIAKPDTNYYCEKGRFLVGKHVISEAEVNEKFEWLSVSDILKKSSNIGTTKIAFDLTFPKLDQTLRSLGIGEKTGIEIPGESRGIYTDKLNITPLKLSNLSFGQGIATTGTQILMAYAAIVNNGILVEPTIIKNKKRNEYRVFSKKTADSLTDMLVSVVEDGTGGAAKIPHFKMAGKTSTAQKASKNGGYEGYIAGFAGFPVNVENKFVIYVYVDDPKGKYYYGNKVAGPIFKKIAQYILYKNKDLKKLNLDDTHENQLDFVNIKQASSRAFDRGKTPDFSGLDKRSANILSQKHNMQLKHRGVGVVKSQNPKAGFPLKKDQIIELNYILPDYE